MKNLNRAEREKLEKCSYIMQCAKGLFNCVGFENTTMNDISKKSEFTNRTIYRYFQNKDDLFYAVLCKYYEELTEKINSNIANKNSGYEKITSAFLAYKDFSIENPRFASFTIRANEILKTVENNNFSPYQKKYIEINHNLFNEVVTLFSDAQKDGSVRNDAGPVELAISLTMLLSGFMDMLASSGKQYAAFFNLNEKDIANFTMAKLFELLK